LIDIEILTLFPGIIEGVLNESILKRARENGFMKVRVVDIRTFTTDRHRTADDAPYGGGAGMVMKVEPVVAALESLPQPLGRVVAPTPRGMKFDASASKALAVENRLTFICGHYEGMDERIYERWVTDEYSIGDYVVTGGELPALVMIDAVVRHLPGVLGDERSVLEDSFAMGMLEYPQYTRPSEFRGKKVPEVLLSGDHEAIRTWREEQALRITRDRRPDLLS